MRSPTSSGTPSTSPSERVRQFAGGFGRRRCVWRFRPVLYVAVGITSQWRTGMPRVLIRFPGTIYTVDRAVGRNAPNDRLDVLLVQFLLFLSTNNPWWDLGKSQSTLTVRPGMRAAI